MCKSKHRFIAILTVLCALAIWFNYSFSIILVNGDSMNPTYEDGNWLIARKHAEIRTGDVIVFTDCGEKLIKRVWACSGDTVTIRNHFIYINGIQFPQYRCNQPDAVTVLADGEYYVLGDNAENSIDSRVLGVILEENIIATIMS